MIKYKLSGELKIEMEDEKDFSSGRKISFIYPVQINGLGYSFEQFLEKKNELQNVIKEFMDREI